MSSILLETGDVLLLESATDQALLEDTMDTAPQDSLLMETGSYLLLEDGSFILPDTGGSSMTPFQAFAIYYLLLES